MRPMISAMRPGAAPMTALDPVHVLRKIAGHGSLVTTQRYLHPDGQSIAAAGAALSAHLTARTGDWSQSGPKLRLVQGTAGPPPTHEDAR
jgi:hypothetical protein